MKTAHVKDDEDVSGWLAENVGDAKHAVQGNMHAHGSWYQATIP
jgi:hypothetical protein